MCIDALYVLYSFVVTVQLDSVDSELDYIKIAELLLRKDSLLALHLADVPLLRAEAVTGKLHGVQWTSLDLHDVSL